MLKKIDAWETSDRVMHRSELDALAHHTNKALRKLTYETSITNIDGAGALHLTVAKFIFDNLDRIGLIVDTYRTERRRIVEETKVDEAAE